jgi:Stage II sporulation protein E (SpoIIE)
VLLLVALSALVAGDRVADEARADRPDRAHKEHKEHKRHKVAPVPVLAPVKAPVRRVAGRDDDDGDGRRYGRDHDDRGRGRDDDDDDGDDEDGAGVPRRTQSIAAPVAPVPVESLPAPVSQPPVAASPAAPAELKGDRPAAGPRRTRTIRMRKGGGSAPRSSPVSRPGGRSVLGTRATGSSNSGQPTGARLVSSAEPATKESPAGDAAKPSGRPSGERDKDSAVSPVVRTVQKIVEVVPKPLKILLAALAGISALLGTGYLLVAARARRLDRQRAELLQEVGLLQTALLPPVPGTVGAVRTSVAYRPSDGPGAGGDFYDALTLPGGKAAFILGDVSGHGRQALARTAFARFTLRAYLEAGLEPRIALQVAGRVIDQHLDGHFATVVIAVHDPADGSLTYACAGHPAPIVVGPTRPEPILAASAPPIGLELRTGVRQTTLPLPPGSIVCLYTDGLAESRTEEGILGRPRLADIVAELGRGATATGLLNAVSKEARLVTDDMATVLISPTAGVTSGGFRAEQLEVDAEEAENGLAERFLEACEVRTVRLHEAAAEARSLADSHGGAVLHVRFGPRGAQVEVLPRNVESLEAASQRAAATA